MGVLFNFTLDIIHKHSKFSKALSKKDFEFVPIGDSGLVTFNLSLILLPTEVNLIPKEKNYKKDVFVAFSPSSFKIIFALLTKVIAFEIQVSKV